MNHMHTTPLILADDTEGLIRIGIFVLALVIWGVKSLANLANKSNQQQKERLRAVRQSMEQAQRLAQQQRSSQPPPRPPVQLAPGIAQRIPQQRFPQRRTPRAPTSRLPAQRPATNYNAMTKQPSRPANLAPPPLPGRQQPAEEVVLLTEAPAPAPAQVASTHAKPVTVGAAAIRRWLRPSTLRQQFILTELFQPPLALRESRDVL